MNTSKELTLADIMNRTVRVVMPDCTLSEAARQMNEAHLSSLLVMSENRPLGIITERDLLKQMGTHADPQKPVSTFMSAPVLTASPDTGFTAAYAQALNHNVRHLVVVDQAGRVIGLASETDFRNHLGADLLRRLDDLEAVMDVSLPQLPPDARLDQAIELMLLCRTSYALIVEQGCATGILTERDMAGFLAGDGASVALPLAKIMHTPVVTASRHTPVFEMAGLMQKKNLRHLVVTGDDGQVMGVITLHKLMERIASTVMNEQVLRHQESLENSRQHAESLLQNIMQTITDLIWLKDVDGVYLSCNRMFERFFGASEAQIVGKTDYDFVTRELADFFHQNDKIAMAAGKPTINEEWLTFSDDGHRALMETTKSPMFDTQGQLIGVLGIAHDITEHRFATEKMQRLTQLYAALSQCNQAIVRSSSETELFTKICREAVQLGGLKMAWVGMLDQEGVRVNPVAFCGNGSEYLQDIRITTEGNSPYGLGPTGTAIRENRSYWCQDYVHDPVTEPWHERAEKFGWAASAALPLCCNGIPVGAFTVYSTELNGFDDASRNLLIEMAVDISYALDNFERERVRAKLEIQSNNERIILELLARGEPVQNLLTQLADIYQKMYPGMLCSVLLLSADGRHLKHAAAAGLPAAYCDAIDGAEIGNNLGSCGTAAYTGKTVIVSDIANDPRWESYKVLALSHGLAACWSVPILSTREQVLGTFALYYRTPRTPSTFELSSLERGAHLASLAIERAQIENRLKKLSQVVEQSPNMIEITDLDAKIEYVNAAYLKTTGYELAEVLGKNPRLLQSGKTPQATYEAMWADLSEGKTWRGEFINQRRDGSEYIESVMISTLRQADGRVTNYLAIKEDITKKKQAEARILQLAHFDALTGLPNLILLKDRVAQAISLVQRGNRQLAVLFLDIDHFKNINDTLGHRIGDQLLIQLAARLGMLVRDEDTLARLGGDEFIIVLPGTDVDGAAHVAEKVLQTIAEACHIETYELVVTPSIGIAMYPADGMDFDRLYQCADVAMYRAKKDGRNTFRFFTAEMQARSARRMQLESALRQALVREQFELHYQPQISMQDGHVVGAEALLRWHHPELGQVSPAEFIPVAEDSGLILAIGEWVLRTAVTQAKHWMDSGQTPIVIAVNLSAVQFRQTRLPERVINIIGEAGLSPEYIELELTESVAMDSPMAAIAVMDNLHAHGIRMSIDDFGTGYSSLSYLKKFKVSKLKIDQSFVHNLAEDAESRAIVTAIITLAASLGFQTIAEGVETAAQLAFLRLQGCNEVQGYYFSKPLTVEKFEAYMREQHEI